MSPTESLMLNLNAAETRAQIAIVYADGLLRMRAIDWRRINRIIVKRWSVSGLRYIKKRAWEIREKGLDGQPKMTA